MAKRIRKTPTTCTRTEVANHAHGICCSVQAWISERWEELKAFAARVWRGVRHAVSFVVDLGKLAWAFVFDPDAFEMQKIRFQATYLSVRVNEKVLAHEFAKALAA